ncbi:MAG: chromosome segregation protein ScpA [Clostridiales bacterium]|nr:chromosome segregation protein ScpA [Clostridiales bacterium]
MNNILTLETTKYAIRLDNFEGPLDLLCHLVDKNKMEIHDVNITEIADQYIEYLNEMEELNLEIASEFLVMASTLLYLKSKSLLPKQVEDEGELTEEELIYRIIEYKKYKEISKTLKEFYEMYSKRFFKIPDKIELPAKKIQDKFSSDLIYQNYKNLLDRETAKVNKNAINIQRLAVTETVTIASKVKDIFRELVKKQKFIFNKLCISKKYNKLEVITAFSGVLELTRKNKIIANQEMNFGDIIVERSKKKIEGAEEQAG